MPLDLTLLDHEPAIRLAGFALVFAIVAAGEAIAPRRVTTLPRTMRWTANLGLVALNTLLLRLALPAAAAGVAAAAQAHGWGLLNHWPLSAGLAVPLAIVAMDFAIWLQHVVFHAVPLLWRLHRVHHADPDYDLTTGARFHPVEILLSMGIKCATIAVLGPPVVAVVLFELLLNATAMFNHGNLRLPAGVDRRLRWLVVTPDMHRVHHSIEEDESGTNFGFSLPWWDRLFGTYRAQPRAGHAAMTIGLRDCRDPRDVARLAGLLRLPWRSDLPPAISRTSARPR